MGQFRDYLREARESSVPTEFRVVLSELKKTYNQGEVPSEKELEIVAEKFMLDVEKFVEFAKSQFKMNESAVGTPGRTTEKDAEEHINDELIAEFKKIIKKLGGKTVAKVLLDKLGQKAEIKDEIEHIEDIIDNSNY